DALATRMQDAWLAFAHTGDPGWPAYDPTTRATMLFGETCEVVDDPMSTERAAWEGLPTA
ncbi:MAG TPA: carboxylesterase/lipase family protein, partial [Acidimicrobiia bacterium]|nr:carboxylesterase/lipase family protein [Acidimicrobiia bacterium]